MKQHPMWVRLLGEQLLQVVFRVLLGILPACTSVTMFALCTYLAYDALRPNPDTGLSLWGPLWALVAGGALQQTLRTALPRHGAMFTAGLKDQPNDALLPSVGQGQSQGNLPPPVEVSSSSLPE